jgi:putative hemolysin
MNTYKSWLALIVLVIFAAGLTSCQQVSSEGTDESLDDQNDGQLEPSLNMANPAAVYCEGLGYTLELRESETGANAACIYPDGSECSEWDFLAGRCGNEFSYCSQQGYEINYVGTNIAMCVFEDGFSCGEFSYFKGECQPADDLQESAGTDSQLEEKDAASDNSGIQVVGWMGFVVSTPDGAQFDDYVVLLPEGEVGEYGIEGASEEADRQIESLRDQEQPGKYAHFWGTLNCGVMDYSSSQLLVERLRVDGPGEFFPPDRIEGWEGTIYEFSYAEPGAPQPDDAFILVGDYPVQFGIDSAISAETGERDLSKAIAELREGGEIVRIWGEMVCGVPDAGGCHIEVNRIESGGEVYEITPAW